VTAVPDGHWCECGNRGCWEQYASGNSLVREARALLVAGGPMADALRTSLGVGPDALTGPHVTAAAMAGDSVAVALLADVGRWLGLGIADVVAGLDPEVVVIGGGVSAAGELLVGPAREAFEATLTGRGFRTYARLELATFRNDAGLVGAADLARLALREPPDSARFGFWPRRRRKRRSKRSERLVDGAARARRRELIV
jgi:glucokinase